MSDRLHLTSLNPPLRLVTSSRFRQGSAKGMSTVLMPQGSEEEGAAQFLILVPSHEAVQISEHRCSNCRTRPQ